MASLLPLTHKIPLTVRGTFFLFLFSLPFEAIDLGFMSGSLSITKLFGVLFFGVSLWFRNICFARIPYHFFWFVAYLGIYIWMGVFVEAQPLRTFISSIITMSLLFVFFLILSNLFRYIALAREGLLAFSLGSVLSAMGLLLGLTGKVIEEGANVRMSALGFNANELALILVIGLIILVGLALEKGNYRPWTIPVFGALTVVNLMGILYTGSRSAIGALLIGLAFYPLPYRGSRRKLTTFIAGGLLLVGTVLIILGNPGALERFSVAIQKGDSSREYIYAHAINMFLEKPILGWGPIECFKELGSRVGTVRRDPHNIFLYLVLEVGIVGAFPFLFGLWLCGMTAWKARKGNWGMMPIALAIALFLSNLSHSFLTKKSFWLVLAIVVAMGMVAAVNENRQRLALNAKGSNLRSVS